MALIVSTNVLMRKKDLLGKLATLFTIGYLSTVYVNICIRECYSLVVYWLGLWNIYIYIYITLRNLQST